MTSSTSNNYDSVSYRVRNQTTEGYAFRAIDDSTVKAQTIARRTGIANQPDESRSIVVI